MSQRSWGGASQGLWGCCPRKPRMLPEAPRAGPQADLGLGGSGPRPEHRLAATREGPKLQKKVKGERGEEGAARRPCPRCLPGARSSSF